MTETAAFQVARSIYGPNVRYVKASTVRGMWHVIARNGSSRLVSF